MKQIFISLVISCIFVYTANAQHGSGKSRGSGTIFGKVKEAKDKKAAQYANVILYKLPDSALVTGIMADKKGEFIFEKVPFGRYYVVADFIGFEKQSHDVMLNPKQANVELPTFFLHPAAQNIDEVVVSADYAQVEYKIDKKVVHVSQDLTSASGTAADVLENVPSVEVDIEGNVSMRGSGNFTVLINGRPSVLDSNDALQQIPASNIKNIELITNPSAKYDPDGTAGIINIITKKKKDEGFSGVFNAGLGLNDKYKLDAILNYKTEKFVFSTGFNLMQQTYVGDFTTDRIVYGDTLHYYDSEGEHRREHGGQSVNFGIQYNLGHRTDMSVSAKYGTWRFAYGGTFNTYDYYTQDKLHQNYHISTSDKPREKDYYRLTYSLLRKFDYKGHQLEGLLFWSDRNGLDNQITEEWDTDENWLKLPDSYAEIIESEDENRSQFRAKLDYTLPTGKNSKLESGIQAKLISDIEDFGFSANYVNPEISDYNYTNHMDFQRDIYAAYATFGSQFKTVAYQIGLRTEYTDREISDKSAGKNYVVNRFDYFPTLHLSREFKGGHKFQASYTKRINRPRGYYLEPFESYMDENNIRKGNAELLPEYIDSYELNYQKRIGRGSFVSLETFFRQTDNLITRINTLNDDGVIIHEFANMNRDQSFGTELSGNIILGRKLTVNLSAVLYDYKIEGEVQGESVDSETITWRANSNTTFKITPATRIQLMAGYRGASVTAQGRSEGFLSTSLGVKQELFKRRANLTLQVRNLLGTMQREMYIENSLMYEHSVRTYEFPIAQINFAFYLNQKPERGRKGRNNDDMDDMGE